MSVAPSLATRAIHRLFKMAVWAGAETAVRLHIARGDDVNAMDEAGLTPLMIAASRNKAAVCRLLIEAGADLAAQDASGRRALEIATNSGAMEAAAAIDLALSQQLPSVAVDAPAHGDLPAEESLGQPVSATPSLPPAPILPHPSTAGDPATEGEAATPPTPAVASPPARMDFEDDGEALDLSGWEAEEESTPPIDDRPVAVAHVATQEAIGRHIAFDDSADWADFEADLPFHAAPLLRAQDAEGRIEIRALLLRASREGSVPEQSVEDVCRDADGARNQATEALLGVVVNDMGAESDERFECLTPFDSSVAFVDPDESAEESETIDEALAFLDNLRSRHNEPIRLYMREAQRTVLLTAEEEAELGRSMEGAADDAIDALALWPAGVRCLLRAIGSAREGATSLNTIVSSPREAATPVDAAGPDELSIEATAIAIGPADQGAEEGAEEGEADTATAEPGALDAFALADDLARLIDEGAAGADSRVRAALASLSLRRSFLIGLRDVAADCSAEGDIYARAIRSLIGSRDRMVRANLRLVISMAKRYMHSGLPIDDLIQEGNIGLVSAVDKFDWRRGFRFSTMATWWIRQQIWRSIADSSLAIRLPVHVHDIAQRFPREGEAFEKVNGRPPTIKELAELVGHDSRKVEALLRAVSAPLPIDSLDGDPSIEAPENPDPFEAHSATELRAALDALLADLGARPEKIVRLRFGFRSGIDEPQTLEEIGALFDVTRERVRQIESKALTKLKHPARLARLIQWSLDPEKHGRAKPASQGGDPEWEIPPPPPEAPLSRAPLPRAPATRESATPPTAPPIVGGKRLTRMERALREARLLDIPVEQTADGERTTTWVRLKQATDARGRGLVRSLLNLGFEHYPGQGFWK